jgi:hypothetical protein
MRRLPLAFALVTALVAAGLSIPATSAASSAPPVYVTATPESNQVVEGDGFELLLAVSQPIANTIDVEAWEPGANQAYAATQIKRVSLKSGQTTTSAYLHLMDEQGASVLGLWHVRVASFGPYGAPFANSVEFDELVVAVPATPVVFLFADPVAPVNTQLVQLSATISRSTAGPARVSGSVRFTEAGGILATGQLQPGSWGSPAMAEATVAPLKAGEHQIVATFYGPDGTAGPSSAPLVVEVLPDTQVSAHDVIVTPSVFYPVKDGYLDTLTIKGQLDEPARVSVAISSGASGEVVRRLTGSKPTGPYQFTWDGRSSSGVLQPAGKYRVVQTLVDQVGNRLTATATATLSHKVMTYSTASVTASGASGLLSGTGPDYLVYRAGSTLIAQSFGTRIYGDWLTIRYPFKLAHTPVKTVRFEVLSDCPPGAHGGILSMSNNGGSLGRLVATGCNPAWYSVTVPVTSLAMAGNVVTGDVYLEPGLGSFGDGIRISQVKLDYTYGVLR